MASQTDWLSSDVKVYQTMVSLDDAIPDLRPGMSAEVTISTDIKRDYALTIPLQAILGGMGPKRKCYVMTERGPELRNIVLATSDKEEIEIICNEKVAEVVEGLNEGDRVVLNPRTLVNEASKSSGKTQKDGALGSEGGRKGGPGGGEKGMRKKGGGRGPGGGAGGPPM